MIALPNFVLYFNPKENICIFVREKTIYAVVAAGCVRHFGRWFPKVGGLLQA